jgi:DnaK suppressor protein
MKGRRSAAAARKTLARRYDEAYLAWMTQEALTTAMREDLLGGPGDEADIAARRAQLDEQNALTTTMRTHLDDLTVALRRCDEGSYGRCETCQNKIPDERLDLFPAATRCVSCQARREHR